MSITSDHVMPSYGLAIHTSSPDLGLALSNFAGETRQQVWPLGRDLSSQLHLYVRDFLAPQTWTDLAFLAVAIGPGGFTGTRLGVVLARTLAQQLEIPLFGISSLAAIAHSAKDQQQSPIAVQMPAQRGVLYTAIYQPAGTGLVAQQPDRVCSPEEWQHILTQNPTFSEKGSPIGAEANQGQQAIAILELAYQNWQEGERPNWSATLPFYGQHPVER